MEEQRLKEPRVLWVIYDHPEGIILAENYDTRQDARFACDKRYQSVMKFVESRSTEVK